MYFEQFHLACLSHASYMAGSEGVAAVVDPQADALFPHIGGSPGDEIRFGPGDTLFVGDLGCPDLSPEQKPQQLAGLLYQVSNARCSAIGEQRITNHALQAASREEFVRMLTDTLPERPAYFARDAEINCTGAGALEELPSLQELCPAALLRLEQSGAIVRVTQPDNQFGAGHVRGSVNMPLSGQFASWAGALLGLETDLLMAENIAEGAGEMDRAAESRTRLVRVGTEHPAGYPAGGIEPWQRANQPLEQLRHITVQDLDGLCRAAADLQIADVRRPAEWEEGHVRGALLMPLNPTGKTMRRLDPARPLAVHCKRGHRSAIAAGLLQRAGFHYVVNVTGGFDAWKVAGLPVERVARA